MQIERRDFLKLASLTAAGAAVPHARASMMSADMSVARPNVLFIVSDQHRTGLTKASGYPLDTSPALDQLAAKGRSFARAYCTAPLCVPSRTSMITGRWPDAHRVRSNEMINDAVYPTHIYKVAKESGYTTGLVGKNHTFLKQGDLDFWREYGLANGWMPQNAPTSYMEFERWMKGLKANIALEPTPFPLEVQYPYRIVSDAMEFIEKADSQPFILQVGFSEPHDPEQVPAPYWNMFPPEVVPPRCAGPDALKQLGYRAQWEYGHQQEAFQTEENWRRYKSNYLGMLRLIDDQLARLMTFLETKGLAQNTVVIYLADHGDYLMDYGLARKGVGLPESLTNIPMVWAGPGIRATGTDTSTVVSNADFFPTVCELIGVPIPHGVQGRSLWPVLQGQDFPMDEFRSAYVTVGVGGLYYEATDKVPFDTRSGAKVGFRQSRADRDEGFDELNKVTQSGLQNMVRMGDWKLIYDMMGYGQMYHLPTDPCELSNVFGQPKVAAEQSMLLAELLMWTIRSQDPLPTGPQGTKWQTKWSLEHNWYAPYRHGAAPEPYIP